MVRPPLSRSVPLACCPHRARAAPSAHNREKRERQRCASALEIKIMVKTQNKTRIKQRTRIIPTESGAAWARTLDRSDGLGMEPTLKFLFYVYVSHFEKKTQKNKTHTHTQRISGGKWRVEHDTIPKSIARRRSGSQRCGSGMAEAEGNRNRKGVTQPVRNQPSRTS